MTRPATTNVEAIGLSSLRCTSTARNVPTVGAVYDRAQSFNRFWSRGQRPRLQLKLGNYFYLKFIRIVVKTLIGVPG